MSEEKKKEQTTVEEQEKALEKLDNHTIDVFGNLRDFRTAQRMAQALAGSSIVPKHYQGNVCNTLIALDIASRAGISPMLVMQNLYIVNGMPSWSSQFIIGIINSSGRYKKPLQFKLTGEGNSRACYCYTEDYQGNVIEGPVISMQMAKDEGWLNKSGSKWKTMPEVMLRYRAASFFGRLHCSDLLMGIYPEDEVRDMEIVDAEFTVVDEVAEEIETHANKETIDIDPVEAEEEKTEKKNPESKKPAQDKESATKKNQHKKQEINEPNLFDGPGF